MVPWILSACTLALSIALILANGGTSWGKKSAESDANSKAIAAVVVKQDDLDKRVAAHNAMLRVHEEKFFAAGKEEARTDKRFDRIEAEMAKGFDSLHEKIDDRFSEIIAALNQRTVRNALSTMEADPMSSKG